MVTPKENDIKETLTEDFEGNKLEENKKENFISNKLEENITEELEKDEEQNKKEEEKSDENINKENVKVFEEQNAENSSAEEDNDTEYKILTFKYNGNPMQINLTEEMVGTNLNDYHYYIVKKINNTYLELYYSDSRFYSRVNASDGAQAIQGGARTIVVGINLNNAIIGINFSDLVSNSMIMNINQCVATNQNIYYGGSVIIYKNCGYEYDEENETEETCDELVKIKVNTNAHKKPGIE